MGWIIALAVVAAIAWLWWRARDTLEIDEGGVSQMRGDDADMARARSLARQEFGTFVERLRAPQPGDEDFGIKAAIGHDGGVEHIWLTNVIVRDDGFEGDIANDPRWIPFKLGDRWRGTLDQVSDWTWFHHGRIQGNFTARAMLPRLPRDQQAQMRAMLEHRWDTRELAHAPWPRDAAMPGQPRPDELSDGDRVLMKAVNDHADAHFGAVPQVFHEIVSPSAHIDLYPYPATAQRPFHVVVTTGMAEQPMQLPPGIEADAHVELVVLLPNTWPLDHASWKRESGYWPMQWLKRVARFHYESGHWLGAGHLLGNGVPAMAIAENARHDSVVLAPPAALPESFHRVTLPDGRAVRFLCLYFLAPEEREALEREGWEAFSGRIDAQRLSV